MNDRLFGNFLKSKSSFFSVSGTAVLLSKYGNLCAVQFMNGWCMKCVCMRMGLRTYTVPSAYNLCTVHHKPKFVDFLCKHNGMCTPYRHVCHVFASCSRYIDLSSVWCEQCSVVAVQTCALGFAWKKFFLN